MFDLSKTDPVLLELHVELDRINCFALADSIDNKAPAERTPAEHHLVHILNSLTPLRGLDFIGALAHRVKALVDPATGISSLDDESLDLIRSFATGLISDTLVMSTRADH